MTPKTNDLKRAAKTRFRPSLPNRLGPRDMIDLQSFIWVQGSDEYEE